MKDKYLILKVKQEKNVVIIKVVNIPDDYSEPMGVPITFIEKYCP